MNQYAVTAASGHLGAEIIRALVEIAGIENVVGLARTPENARSLGVEIRPGDYTKPEELKNSLSGVDVVLLVSGMDKPEKRIDQHRNVISAAKQADVQKIVYTSIQGAEEGTDFSSIVQSNRQTEEDIRSSGLEWVIGRNGIYIEPDIDYIDKYRAQGEIANCAGDGKCGYTTRAELASAYSHMMTDSQHNESTYNLHGEAITQEQLTEYINEAFGMNLRYRPMTVKEYRQERIAELGEFLGTVISGIYEGIRSGAANNPSHFSKVVQREHQSWKEFFAQCKSSK